MLKDKLKRKIGRAKFLLMYSFLKTVAKIHLWTCDNEKIFARAEFEKYVRDVCKDDDEDLISIFMMAFDDIAC